jgi:hypothetical protein
VVIGCEIESTFVFSVGERRVGREMRKVAIRVVIGAIREV